MKILIAPCAQDVFNIRLCGVFASAGHTHVKIYYLRNLSSCRIGFKIVLQIVIYYITRARDAQSKFDIIICNFFFLRTFEPQSKKGVRRIWKKWHWDLITRGFNTFIIAFREIYFMRLFETLTAWNATLLVRCDFFTQFPHIPI